MKIRLKNVIPFGTKICKMSTHPKHKMCAIITNKKNTLLSFGFNQMKSHPKQYYSSLNINPYKIFLHAETHAIMNLDRFDNPYNIYVLRLRQNEILDMSKPCIICQSHIALLTPSIENIFYINKEGKLITM